MHVLSLSTFVLGLKSFFGFISGELLLVVGGHGLFAVFVRFACWCGLFVLR